MINICSRPLRGILFTFVLSTACITSYAQVDVVPDATSDALGNSFETLNQPPVKGFNASFYRWGNDYIINAYYWDGNTTSVFTDPWGYADDPCPKISVHPHGIEVVRDGFQVIPLSTYSQWKSLFFERFPSGTAYPPSQKHYCGREFPVTVSNPAPGNYSIRYHAGNPLSLIDTKFLFTVTEAPPPPPPPAKPCDNTRPLYGAVNWGISDFYLTQDPYYMSYLGAGGWGDAGVIARIPASVREFAKPFKRYNLHSQTVHFYSIYESDQQTALAMGAVYEGDEGLLFDRQVEGTIPLYRSVFVNPGIDMMFFYTIGYDLAVEIGSMGGWAFQGPIGYVCPP